MNDAPCKGCRDRHQDCHSECEKYKEYRADLDLKNARSKEERHIDSTINNLLFNRLKHHKTPWRKKK